MGFQKVVRVIKYTFVRVKFKRNTPLGNSPVPTVKAFLKLGTRFAVRDSL